MKNRELRNNENKKCNYDKNAMKNLSKNRKQRNNKKYNYEYLLKKMLYFPGDGQELLSALGVTLVCHASNQFFWF